jgi:hypothetical protein
MVLLASSVLASARIASAQIAPNPARWQVFGGYSLMAESDVSDKLTFPAGWAIAAAAPLNRWLSLAVDVDGQYDTIPSFGSDIQLASHAFTGGLRASARLGPFVEFGHFLVGAVRSTGSAFGATDTTSQFAMQPGGGFDFCLGPTWAIRGELDVRFMSTGQEIRFVTGLVRSFR